ncbi:glutamate-rich protein 3 [Synchiropus splendidus]|uniref:glutamate-rich protein 3 n=1 Tax=Synchiropus splendidus TaxID=270530 RepID=UPI00237E15BC|nr:glutamate-rich protein 3 [Synchiropus splendidus]
MSHQLNPGLISAYNSLTDKHLAGYFSNTRIRRHLQRAGLITRSGRIVPDKEYRHKQHQRAHQRHVRECLAQAIFHKVLEMERVHQIEIKRKLEEFARRERVLKIKVGRSKRYEEDIHILSPRPPTAAKMIRKQNSGPEGEHSESSESPGSSRPNTAPGNMQRPVRLKPINSHNNAALLRHSSPYRLQATSNENDPFNSTMDKKSRRRVSKMDPSNGVSPYCLPVINNFVTPVPPAIRKCERGVTTSTIGTVRGRRLRPTTTSTGVETNEEQTTLRSSVYQRRVTVNMIYFGKTVHLSHDLTDLRDEVKVFQQHCGGENLCVYKGKLREGDMFQFISKRHRGFPFSLTFFLNGLQVERLSSCCEFKHRKGPRLGGRHGHFGFTGVEGASPCYKCIISMGLDKKPTPPPKRVREDTFLSTKVDMETSRTVAAAVPHSEHEASQVHQTPVTEAPEEDKHADDYAEDFEADDEGPAEETKEERSLSPSSETDEQAKERHVSETEEEEREEVRSRSGSSSAGSDVGDSEAEVTKEERDDDDEEAKEIIQEENSIAPEDQAKSNNSTVDKEPDLLDSAGDSTELEISNTSAGNDNTRTDDSAGDQEAVATEESKPEEEQERGEFILLYAVPHFSPLLPPAAKSVQEKLAEAILQDSRCSSEPELSDTTTEEEEESTRVRHEDTKVPQKAATTCEDNLPGEVSEDQGEGAESRNQEDELEQNPDESPQAVQEEVAYDEVKAEEPIPSSSELKATVQSPELQQQTPDESTVAPEVVEEETGQGEAAPVGQDADVSKMDEASRSEFIQNDEPPGMDNAEAEEVKMVEVEEEHSPLLKAEQEPVTDRQKSEVSAAETDVSVENSSSSSEQSGDTAVEKKADVSTEGEDKHDDKSHGEGDETQACDAGEETIDADKLEGEEEVGEEGMMGKDVREQDKAEEVQSEEKVIEEETENTLADQSDKTENVGDDEEESTAPITEVEEKCGVELDDAAEEKNKDENDNDKEEEQDEHKKETVEEREGGKYEDAETLVKKEKSEDNNVQSEDAGAVARDAPVPRVNGNGEEAGDEGDVDAESGERAERKEKAEGVVCDGIAEGKISEPSNVEGQSNKDEGEEHHEERRTAEADKEEGKTNKDEGEVHQEERRTVEPNGGEGKSNKDEGEEHHEERRTAEANKEEGKTNKDEGEEHQEERRTVEPNGEEGKSNKDEGEEHQEERRTVEPNGEEGKTNKDEGEEHHEERRTAEANEERKSNEGDGEEHQDEKKTVAQSEEQSETKHAEREAEKVTEDEGDFLKPGEEESKANNEVDTEESQTNAEENITKGSRTSDSHGLESRSSLDEVQSRDDIYLAEEKVEAKTFDQCEEDIKTDLDIEKKWHLSKTEIPGGADESEVDTVRAVYESAKAESLESELNAKSASRTKVRSDCEDEEIKNGPSDQQQSTSVAASVAHMMDKSEPDSEKWVELNTSADLDEASKASEEGASVLLQPQVNHKAEAPVGHHISEALANENSVDLVSNWVTVHQTSRYFETFVEPIDDLKDSQVTRSDVTTRELLRSQSPCTTDKPLAEEDMSESKEEEGMEVDQNRDITHEAKEDVKSKNEEVQAVEGLEKKKEHCSPFVEGEEWDECGGVTVESIANVHLGEKPGSVNHECEQENPARSLDEMKGTLEVGENFEDQLEVFEPAGENTSESWMISEEGIKDVPEMPDLTTSKSEFESQAGDETETKPLNLSISGDTEPIQNIKSSKEWFSVDDGLFGQSSYPLLAAVRTESRH